MIRYYIENYFSGLTVTEKDCTKYFKSLQDADSFLSDNFYNTDNYDDFFVVCESLKDGVITEIPIEY